MKTTLTLLLALTQTANAQQVTYEDSFDLTRIYNFYGTTFISPEECGIPQEYAQIFQLKETYTFPISSEAQIQSRDYTYYNEWTPPTEMREEKISFLGANVQWEANPEKKSLPTATLSIPLKVMASLTQEISEYKKGLADLIKNRNAHFSIESANEFNSYKLQIGPIKLELRSPYSLPIKYFDPKPFALAIGSSDRYQLKSMGISRKNLENYFITDPKTVEWAIKCRNGYYLVGSKSGKNHNPTLVRH